MTYRIGAKETVFRGVTFRSALEARWARFFDAIGARWEYEPDAGCPWWAPDFRVFGMLAEVKPVPVDMWRDAEGPLSFGKALRFAEERGGDVLLLGDGPSPWLGAKVDEAGQATAAMWLPGAGLVPRQSLPGYPETIRREQVATWARAAATSDRPRAAIENGAAARRPRTAPAARRSLK